MTTTAVSNKWIACLRPNPTAALRLFCFPFAGGGASTFHSWSRYLPSNLEVCAVQLPGRENRLREPPISRMPSLIEALDEVLPPYLDKPYALFGHSLGALIAFELARQRRRQGDRNLVHLIVSARIAPQAHDVEPPIYQLPQDRFLAKLRELNGTPEAVFQQPELLELLLPILRADFTLNEDYSYQDEDPLDVPLTVFGGMQDPKVEPGQLSAWQAQTSGPFAVKLFPGDHFFLSSAQPLVLSAIAEILRPSIS